MANVNDFACDLCGEVIGTSPTPVLVYVVAGVPPAAQGKEVDLNAIPCPELVRELMAQPVARREYCLKCFGAAIGQPLTLPVAPAPAAP